MGAEAVVEELLKAGANVNPRSCYGVTPLHDAVVSGNYQVMENTESYSHISKKSGPGATKVCKSYQNK